MCHCPSFANAHSDQQSVQNALWARRTSGNVDVHRQNTIDTAQSGVAALAKDPSAAAAGTNRYDDARLWRGLISALQCNLHVARNGAGHEQYVRMPRAGDEVDAKALEIEQWIRRGRDFQLTAVAAPGVHLSHVKRPSQTAVDPIAQGRSRFLEAWTGLHVHLTEPACTCRSVDVERRGLPQLLAGECRDFDVTIG